MIKLTAEDLRRVANMMDSREKHDSMCGVVYASIKHRPNGREYLELEQPCGYAECNSYFYRFEEV